MVVDFILKMKAGGGGGGGGGVGGEKIRICNFMYPAVWCPG